MCQRAAACLRLLVVPLLGAWLALVAVGEEAERADEAGFRPLFDGKTLEGWEGNLKMFRVEDGAIVGGSLYEKIPHNEFLCTRREFGDFELRLEARLRGEGTNAGVQFRSRRVPDHFEVSGYQCDIGTMQDKPIWGWLYDESRRNRFLVEGPDEVLRRVVKPGRWNDLVIRCEGPQVTIWVNGEKTIEYREADDQVARRGIIGLQIHGGPPAEASYRNIRVKELGPSDTRSGTATGPVASEKLAAASATDTDLKLIFVGDVMLDDLPGQVIKRGEDPFREFAEVIRWADVAVANLECVVATGGVAVKKPWVFRAAPEVLPTLKRYFPVVSLANNHTGDYGPDAFLEQLDLLSRHGVAWFGGGRNCAEARLPHVIEAQGMRVALLGYNDYKPRSFEAGPDWPGVAWGVDEQIVADIRAARSRHRADLVIPFMHWGWEQEPANERQRQQARIMIDAGADLVVGSHPHVIQEVEYYQGKLIAYSLGNFVFDGFSDGPERTGWMLRLRLNRQGLVAWDTVVAKLDDEGVPHLDAEAASPSGAAGSARMEERRALRDSPLAKRP